MQNHSTAPAPAVNPFEPYRTFGADFEVHDTRTNKVVAVGFYGRDAAQDECDRLWFDELMAQPAPAEALALAEQLVEELNQVDAQQTASRAEGRTELVTVLRAAYDDLSRRVRALGYDLGPSDPTAPMGTSPLCLYDPKTQRPLNPITARREAAEAATPVGTCAGCGGACADDELYCSAACLDAFDDEPVDTTIVCASCGAEFDAAAGVFSHDPEDGSVTVICSACAAPPEPSYRNDGEAGEWVPLPDAETVRAMCGLDDDPARAWDDLAEASRRDTATTQAGLRAFASLPLPPELLARAIAVLRLGADDLPRELACEASLVADALVKATRPAAGEWGTRRAA